MHSITVWKIFGETKKISYSAENCTGISHILTGVAKFFLKKSYLKIHINKEKSKCINGKKVF